jgi:hypothetical protein
MKITPEVKAAVNRAVAVDERGFWLLVLKAAVLMKLLHRLMQQ